MDEQPEEFSPVSVFFSYAHEDANLRNELEKHLSNLRRQGLVSSWHDQRITAGTERLIAIDNQLNTASIILLLISPDFLASDYCYSVEMQRAIERHEAKEAVVIPIILRPTDWQNTPFSKLQVLPPDGKPITMWENHDEVLLIITQRIRLAIEQFYTPAKKALFEIVVLEVGFAVAKSIFQIWTKDTTVILGVSSNILDIFEFQISDKIAQKKARRQFEAIGEKVGERLFQLFKFKDIQLNEENRIQIAEAVAKTFRDAAFFSNPLIMRNLEPTRLAKQFLETQPEECGHFSKEQTALYQRIIKEACEYMVDIISQLPNLYNKKESTLRDVFKRENQLSDIVDKVLQELRQIQGQLNPMVESERFEEVYRRAVARNLDVLQLFGADVSIASRRHRLSVAYITLLVEQKLPNPFVNLLQTSISIGSKVPVDKALASSSRLIIQGAAGSGKTTLLQWIAVKAALRSFEEPLLHWNTLLPFFISLRHFAQVALPTPETFPALVAPAIAGTMPDKGWVHSYLASGNAIILIDGLDEVAEAQREKIRIWLKELVNVFPNSYFVITSRPHAVKEGWMNREGFLWSELQSMGISDIHTFIDHWHDAVHEELQEETEKSELPILAEHLKKTLKQYPSVRSLATNPLLCAMLCALNRDRRSHLPPDRIELYEACCQLLIDRLDKERNINLISYPSFGYRQKRVLLEDLAYWLIRNGWSEVRQQQVDERFRRKLTNMHNISRNVSGADVRRLFIERTAILREPFTGRIDFTHRTFQEYLAAQAVLDEGDIGVLVQNATNDLWREVIILAAGLSKNRSTDLLRELIKRGDLEKEHRYQLHLLAVSCLETSVELKGDVKGEVERRLSQLVPPKNMADAIAMASAHDLAVPYLSKEKAHTNATVKLCIRSLATIGSDHAFEALEEYASNASAYVTHELLEAWDSSDREKYAQRILSKALKGSCSIHLERLPSLQGFQHFIHLTSLDLSGCERISDLSPLADLGQLMSLSLAGCINVRDLRPLAALRSLNSLDLEGCKLDLNSLTTLTQLTSLSLASCHDVNNLRLLTNLTQLTSLNLTGCTSISDLRPLAALRSLTSLNLEGCVLIGILDPLVSLNQLTTLSLAGCKYINNIQSLSFFPKMTTLNLRGCTHITDLSSLSKLDKMEILYLDSSHRRITIPDNLRKCVKFA